MDPIRPINPNEPQFTILPALPARQVGREQRRPQDEGGDGAGRGREHARPGGDAPEEWDDAEWDDAEWDGGQPAGDGQHGAATEPIIELDVYDEHGQEHRRVLSGLDVYEVPRAAALGADAQQPADDSDDDHDPPVRHIDISA